MKTLDESERDAGPEDRASLGRRILAEVRERPLAWVIMAVFAVAGPVVTRFMFPDAPLAIGVIGGLAFGIYAALSAVPGRFL